MGLRTIKQFCSEYPILTESAIRNLIFKSKTRITSQGTIPGNGLIECGAILRINRKIVIDDERFFEWIRNQNPAPRHQVPTIPALRESQSTTPSSNKKSKKKRHKTNWVIQTLGEEK